jgi:LETM1 and EF-hand domain-containing protein 1
MDMKQQGDIANTIQADLQGNITTEQLETVLKMMRQPPDEPRIKKIIKKLDADGDGRIFVQEILELAAEVGAEGQGIVKKNETTEKH